MKVIELLLSNLHLLHAQPCSAAGRFSGHRPSLDVLSSPFNPWESAILRHRDWEDGKGRRQIQQSSKKLCRPCVQDLKIIKISQGFTRHLTKLQNSNHWEGSKLAELFSDLSAKRQVAFKCFSAQIQLTVSGEPLARMRKLKLREDGKNPASTSHGPWFRVHRRVPNWQVTFVITSKIFPIHPNSIQFWFAIWTPWISNAWVGLWSRKNQVQQQVFSSKTWSNSSYRTDPLSNRASLILILSHCRRFPTS